MEGVNGVTGGDMLLSLSGELQASIARANRLPLAGCKKGVPKGSKVKVESTEQKQGKSKEPERARESEGRDCWCVLRARGYCVVDCGECN